MLIKLPDTLINCQDLNCRVNMLTELPNVL